MPFTEKASIARAGVGSDDAHPWFEAVNTFSYLLHNARQLVTEDGGRDDHAGVKSLAVDFQVGAAGECCFYSYENLACAGAWDGNLFDSHVPLAIEHRCSHFFPGNRVHFFPGNLDEFSHGCIITFSESGEG